MNPQTVLNLLSRNEELRSLRQGVILRECNTQKKELYRVLKIIRSFDKLPNPPRKP